MSQLYYQNTIESKFIKELLRSTYLPLIPIYKLGNSIIKGLTYISDNYIVEAIQNYDATSNLQGPQSLLDSNYFKIKEPYILGKFYPSLTSNFISNNSTYDSNTHKYLGNYLRLIRDLYNIDLFPFYNCWSGDYSDNLRFKLIDNQEYLIDNNETDDGYKMFLVPIRFNQTYTIYLNSNVTIKLGSAYYKNKQLINKDNLSKVSPFEYKSFNYVSFSSPIKYRINKNDFSEDKANINVLNDYLTLFILLPNNSKIVVLEGDYNNSTYVKTEKRTKIIDNESILYNTQDIKLVKNVANFKNINQWTSNDWSHYFIVRSSLLTDISNNNYAFCSRLIEYLLNNVITSQDKISENILRVQEYCSSLKNLQQNGSRYTLPYTKGIWDNQLRKYIYDLVTNNPKYPIITDINGFVDKDSEKIILRGKN